MPVTPQITLTANLKSILDNTEDGGYLLITLCGYGPVLPCVPGTGMLADAGVPQLVGPQEGGAAISVELFGNDVIQPLNQTFYSIAVLDADKNVVQCGNYQFTGTETIDLSQAAQMVAPFGFLLPSLEYLPCAGAGSGYTAAASTVLAVAYNGVLLPRGQALPTLSFTAAGSAITLNFFTQAGDRIDAFVIT